ncbi:starch-binding domain-containing protein 1 [Sceloporus undulatus]|uniref:starch-binding domain-containing protein 1 n=1 Tax=Sceloporus undulatus TaxID=8520 RepID=UPI001C4D4B63|nr:starch-binding domain-containing protein 1 [Sceloporus undulatus]
MAAAGEASEAAGEGAQQQQGSALPPQPLPPPLAAPGGFWAALLVALVAALVAWLWYGRRDGEKREEDGGQREEGAPPGAREADGEPNQRSYESLTPETKQTDVSSPQEPVGNQLAPSGEHCAPSVPNESPERKPSVKEPTTSLMNYKEYLRTEALTFPTVTSEPSPNQESEMHGVTSMEAGASSEKLEERCKEQLCHSVDREEWEIVPEHSEWGSAARKSSVDDASSKDLDLAKRVAAVSPMPQTVYVTFRVHYITHSEAQLIAVTGDHECLGQWHHYVPLRCDKDGFWSDSVVLPVDTQIEWKFIVVENGKVRRWEECDNRTLTTEHEDRVAHKWWGYH